MKFHTAVHRNNNTQQYLPNKCLIHFNQKLENSNQKGKAEPHWNILKMRLAFHSRGNKHINSGQKIRKATKNLNLTTYDQKNISTFINTILE